jgi:hypothetical protein
MAINQWEILRNKKRERRWRNLAAADPTGWTIHTPYHWSRTISGKRLNYWPSTQEWQYGDEVMIGDITAFLKELENATKE